MNSFLISIDSPPGLSSIQSLSRIWLFVTPQSVAHQASLSFTNSWALLKLMSIKLVMPSNHLVLCQPCLLPSIFPCIRVFSNGLVLYITWPKYWSLSFSISPSNEHPGLIAFKDGLVGSLCSPRDSQESSPTPQFKSINSSRLSFLCNPTHPYITTEKTIALPRWTFVGKEMSLIFNMLSRFVITFLPRSKRLLISWLHSSSAVILEPWSILCLFLFLQAQHQAPGAKHFSQLIWFELNLTHC